LVALLGVTCRVAPADIDEEARLLPEPVAAAVNVAAGKVRVVETANDEIVLAADTLVVIDDEILGKPANDAEARGMLARLHGRAHEVVTGVVVARAGLVWAGAVSTRVVMRAYTSAEVDAYIARGEPFDKAGGYAVQDQTFRPVERLEGCYLNVVGLPLCAVVAGMTSLGEKVVPSGPPPCEYCTRGQPLVSRSAS
jgi:MAF protein